MDPVLASRAASFARAHPAIHKFYDLVVSSYTAKSFLFLAILFAIWLAGKPGSKNRRAAIAGFAGCFVTLALCRIVQDLGPHRPRPIDSGLFDFPAATHIAHDWSSFPSDTSGFVFSIATAVLIASRPIGYATFAWAIIGPAFGKLIIGAHYFSDVVTGSLIGVISTAAVYQVITRYQWPAKAVRPVERLNPVLLYFVSILVVFQLGTFFDDARRVGSLALGAAKHHAQASSAPMPSDPEAPTTG